MALRPLQMEIGLVVIENLGINLYGELSPVISGIVANSWDADATKVKIGLPVGDINDDSSITISDNGNGMSRDEILDKYLRIGRKRRDEDGDKTPKGRDVIGRKGIERISVFGVARKVTVTTIREGKKNEFKMDIDDILKCAKAKDPYEPVVTATDEDVNKPDGTTITLAGLKRMARVVPKKVRKNIARSFSIIGDGFKVYVNGDEINWSDKF